MLLDKPISSTHYSVSLTSSVSYTSFSNQLSFVPSGEKISEKNCICHIYNTSYGHHHIIVIREYLLFRGNYHILHHLPSPLFPLVKWKDATRKQALKPSKIRQIILRLQTKSWRKKKKKKRTTLRPAVHRTAGTQPGCEGLTQPWRAGSPGSPCTAGLFGDAVDREKGVNVYVRKEST